MCGNNADTYGVAIGYGIDQSSEIHFFNVRLSWGSDWGENGYIRMSNGNDSFCGACRICGNPRIPLL